MIDRLFLGDDKAEIVDATKGKELEGGRSSRLCKNTLSTLGDEKAEIVDATKGKELEGGRSSRLCKYSLYSR